MVQFISWISYPEYNESWRKENNNISIIKIEYRTKSIQKVTFFNKISHHEGKERVLEEQQERRSSKSRCYRSGREGREGRTCRLAGLVSVQEASKLFPVSSKSETRIRRSSTMAERGRQGGVGEGKRERERDRERERERKMSSPDHRVINYCSVRNYGSGGCFE